MKFKNYLTLMMAVSFITFCGLFVSCDDEEIEPYVSHTIHYVSEVEGYPAFDWTFGYDDTDKNLFMEFKGDNYPFCEYSMEIRKGSAKGDVVKSYTVRGDDIINDDKVAERPTGKTSETWEDVPNYSEFDAYIVLTAVKFPEISVEFDTENCDLKDDYKFYFWTQDKTTKNNVLTQSLTEINGTFEVFAIDKTKDAENLDFNASEDMADIYISNITVDGVAVNNVFLDDFGIEGAVIDSVVDWKKFTYAQLDPLKPHSIKITVKQTAIPASL